MGAHHLLLFVAGFVIGRYGDKSRVGLTIGLVLLGLWVVLLDIYSK